MVDKTITMKKKDYWSYLIFPCLLFTRESLRPLIQMVTFMILFTVKPVSNLSTENIRALYIDHDKFIEKSHVMYIHCLTAPKFKCSKVCSIKRINGGRVGWVFVLFVSCIRGLHSKSMFVCPPHPLPPWQVYKQSIFPVACGTALISSIKIWVV